MKPEEKAKELERKFAVWAWGKTHAITCVKEIIEQWEYIDTYLADYKGKLNPNLKYWREVLNYLEK